MAEVLYSEETYLDDVQTLVDLVLKQLQASQIERGYLWLLCLGSLSSPYF